ncbi:MAG: methyltransferase domain-containing protein [Deltaproteobacteria bacterium]|nr:methyltransferase domain-containing protein [Deltaproteobacteria bacterium]
MKRVLQHRHQILLDDTVRMQAYTRAIRAIVRPGDIVADLGTGTGALAFLALDAGAAHVHAVEVEPHTLALARHEAAARGVADRITFYAGLAQAVRPKKLVDAIMTETLGSLGFDENILPLLCTARRVWLKPGGRIIPHGCALTIAPTEFVSWRRSWQLRDEAIPAAQLIANPQTSPVCAFRTARATAWQFSPTFRITRNATLTGFAGWFTLHLTPTIRFATGPHDPPTHWRQAFLPLRRPLTVTAGQRLKCWLRIAPDASLVNSIVEYDFERVGP